MKRRIAKTALLILLMAGVLLSGACTPNGDLQSFVALFRQARDKPAIGTVLTAAELIRKITDAIRPDADPQEIYDQIPENQRRNLDRNQFQLYVQLLRRGLTGDILSYSHLKTGEMEDIRETMLKRRPDQFEIIEQMQGYWIHHQRDDQTETQFALFIHMTKEGRAYLSVSWIEQVLSLADFANLYIEAVDDGNRDALKAMLQPSELSTGVREAKASRIIDYYEHSVSTQLRDFQLSHVRMDAIGLMDRLSANTPRREGDGRQIEIISDPWGRYKINDIIPDSLRVEDVAIRFADEPLFDFIDPNQQRPVQVHAEAIEAILGEPLQHNELNCLTNSDGISQMELPYETAELRIIGECDRHRSWAGEIISIQISDPAVSLSNGLRPGLELEDVLRVYPFADETNYRIEGKTAWGRMILRIGTDGETVTGLKLEWKKN